MFVNNTGLKNLNSDTPAAFRFTRDSSAGRLSRLLETLTADSALLLYVLIVVSATAV